MYRFIVILAALALFVACGDDATRSPPSDDLNQKLLLLDTSNQELITFNQGETIRFSLSITNTSDTETTLNFSSGQQYDIYIRPSTATSGEIWRWSDDKAFTAGTTSLVISPMAPKVVTAYWDQTLMADGVLEIGSYQAYARFLTQTESAQFSFTIQ